MDKESPSKEDPVSSVQELSSGKTHQNDNLQKEATPSVTSMELNLTPQPLAEQSKVVIVFTNIYDALLIIVPILLIGKTGVGVGFWANQNTQNFQNYVSNGGPVMLNEVNALVWSYSALHRLRS
jgi:hypothetical protein